MVGILVYSSGAAGATRSAKFGEVAEGAKALGRVNDATKNFRIVGLARTDRLTASEMIGGNFVVETRMIMRHRASPQTAQRLSSVIPRFFLDAFDEEAFPRVLRGIPTSIQKVVAAWVECMIVAFGDVKDQTR